MKVEVEIDVDEIVKNSINQEIVDSSTAFENIVDDFFEKSEVKNQINKRINEIVKEYLASDKGKEFIIDWFKEGVNNEPENYLDDDKIKCVITDIIKKAVK